MKGRVVSLGMFIIDRFEDGSEQIGGGGVFAMVAARMFLPAARVGLIVDVGTDFPPEFLRQLRSYGDEMLWIRPRDGPTTRALNVYSGGTRGAGHQSFRYLTPRVQLWPADLLPPSPLWDADAPPAYIHLVCSAERAQGVLDQIDEIVMGDVGKGWSPKLVWEPLPLSCVPGEREKFSRVAPRMAVVSPNLLEAQTLLGFAPDHSREAAEEAATALQALCRTEIVLRASDLGSYAHGWVPAYWTEENQHRVVDPTGGGNAFVGGLCAGLTLTTGDIQKGAIYGSASASFVIQQHGLPVLADGLWNGEDAWSRVREIERATSRYTRKPTTIDPTRAQPT